MSSKYIVVTGAAGFIGSCVIKHLNQNGFSKLLLVDDIKKTEKWKNLVGKRYLDFISKQALFDWLKDRPGEVKAIIHLGACSDTMEMDGNYLMENNYRYTIKLAERALLDGIRFIYASSAATYGDGLLGFSDAHEGIEAFKPLNLYGFSKHIFDLWAKNQGILDQIVGLKYFNVFGPNEQHKGRMASMIYKMVPLVRSEGVIRLFQSTDRERYADGDQCRDFIYVKDAARMTCAFLDNDHSGLFNIGSGQTTTWNLLAKAIFKALKQPESIEYIAMPETLSKQYQNYTCADMSKYKRVFNVQNPCEFTIEQAVSDYVENYLLKDRQW